MSSTICNKIPRPLFSVAIHTTLSFVRILSMYLAKSPSGTTWEFFRILFSSLFSLYCLLVTNLSSPSPTHHPVSSNIISLCSQPICLAPKVLLVYAYAINITDKVAKIQKLITLS